MIIFYIKIFYYAHFNNKIYIYINIKNIEKVIKEHINNSNTGITMVRICTFGSIIF